MSETAHPSVIELARIKELIPHRYPFLLIDRLEQVILSESAVGIKHVTVNEPFFPGHFPDMPIMPGVLIIEALAQTAAALVAESIGREIGKESSGSVYFLGIDQARFRKPVMPGCRLELHVNKIHARRNVWKFRGEALVEGQKMAEAQYSAMIPD